MTSRATKQGLILLVASSAAFAQEAPTFDQTVPVADGVEAPAPEPPTDEELLEQEFTRYKELLADGILDEADTVAKRVVELAIRTSGPDSLETARALSNLGTVQYRTGQFESAAQNYESAITIIEEVEDRLNASLVNPLRGLGASQMASGRPDLASLTYARGVHITHVNEGPHNMGQVELLESLAESQLKMGLLDEAKNVHQTIYSLNLRFFRSNPLDMVPSLMRRARWQNRTGYILNERSTYRHIIRIIENATSKHDVRLIRPLTNLGKSFFYQDLSGVEPFAADSPLAGELYFKRALRIANESPDTNWDIQTDAMIAIGDFNMMQSAPRLLRAKKHYGEALTILMETGDTERGAKLRAEFGKPKPLRYYSLPRFAGSATAADRANPEVALREGTIRFSYDVSERGRVANFKVVEANPSEFYDIRRSIIREMRSRQFRPRYDNTEAVATTGLIDSHRFFYKQSDLQSLRKKEAAEQEAETQEESAKETETGT